MMDQETNSNFSAVLLGDYLKQKRLDKNFTLEKLSQKTKISVNILKCLEANDFSHLPSAAYIKGFVTSYVKVLGLPLDEAIGKMETTYQNILGKPFPALNHTKNMAPSVSVMRPPVASTSPSTPAAEDQSPHEVIESGDSIIQNTKSFLPFIIFGAVIILFIGGYKLVSTLIESEVNSHKEKDLGPKIESSSALLKNPPKVEAPKPVDATATPAATTSPDQPASATPAEEVKKEEPKPVTDLPRNFPTIEFKQVKSKLFSVKADDPANQDSTILPENIRSSMNPDIQNVYIKAVDGNTWLSYKIDAHSIVSVIINQGNDLFLQGSEIRIFLGNVNVTRIFYNNYLIDAPTKSGVKSLIFPESSNSKFSLPLFPKAKDDIIYTGEDYVKRMQMEEDEMKKRQQAN